MWGPWESFPLRKETHCWPKQLSENLWGIRSSLGKGLPTGRKLCSSPHKGNHLAGQHWLHRCLATSTSNKGVLLFSLVAGSQLSLAKPSLLSWSWSLSTNSYKRTPQLNLDFILFIFPCLKKQCEKSIIGLEYVISFIGLQRHNPIYYWLVKL